MRTDLDLVSNSGSAVVGGSYFEGATDLDEVGQEIASSAYSGLVAPTSQADLATSHYFTELYEALRSAALPGEHVLGLYERGDANLIAPLLYSAERIADFEIQVMSGTLRRLNFFAVPAGKLDDRLSI